MPAKNWMAHEAKREKKAGTKGSLTRQAHRAGYDNATSFARHVRSNPDKFSTLTKQRSNMAMRYAAAR
jgi:hypothetical protein